MKHQKILIQIQQKIVKISKERINQKIRQILKYLGYEKHEISVVITDNAHIRELNQLYRGIDAPTNVLSFSMLEGEFPSISNLLGDLVISAERAYQESQEFGITLDERMSQLLVHGILHLVGYDHETDDHKTDDHETDDHKTDDHETDDHEIDEREADDHKMEKKSLELIRLIEPNNQLDFF